MSEVGKIGQNLNTGKIVISDIPIFKTMLKKIVGISKALIINGVISYFLFSYFILLIKINK
jgi:hypothetical protein